MTREDNVRASVGTGGVGTMRAIVQRAYGSTSVLALEEVGRPSFGDSDVLIRVRASSINHGDVVYLTGEPMIARLALGLSRPRQPVRGKDVAGVVEAVGTKVTRLRVGDTVFAEVEAGAFAEYVAAPETRVALKPANISFEEAAVVPLAARTALQGLRQGGGLEPGRRVLINGASGGVGTFAVQLATAFGAVVTGVCSTRNVELVRSLGADHVVDYSSEDFTLSSTRYDVIFDSIGNHSLRDLRRVLAVDGTLVLSSGTGGRLVGPMGRILRALLWSPFLRQSLRTFTATVDAASLDELRDLIEAGRVSPVIDRGFPLAEVSEALRYFIEEHTSAKIAISV